MAQIEKTIDRTTGKEITVPKSSLTPTQSGEKSQFQITNEMLEKDLGSMDREHLIDKYLGNRQVMGTPGLRDQLAEGIPDVQLTASEMSRQGQDYLTSIPEIDIEAVNRNEMEALVRQELANKGLDHQGKPIKTKYDVKEFEKHVWEQLGGNPYMINVAQVAKEKFNAQKQGMWHYYFGPNKQYGAMLSEKDRKGWAEFAQAQYANIYNEANNERNDKIEAAKFMFGRFDEARRGEEATLKSRRDAERQVDVHRRKAEITMEKEKYMTVWKKQWKLEHPTTTLEFKDRAWARVFAGEEPTENDKRLIDFGSREYKFKLQIGKELFMASVKDPVARMNLGAYGFTAEEQTQMFKDGVDFTDPIRVAAGIQKAMNDAVASMRMNGQFDKGGEFQGKGLGGDEAPFNPTPPKITRQGQQATARDKESGKIAKITVRKNKKGKLEWQWPDGTPYRTGKTFKEYVTGKTEGAL